jgi:hypothetical protein
MKLIQEHFLIVSTGNWRDDRLHTLDKSFSGSGPANSQGVQSSGFHLLESVRN